MVRKNLNDEFDFFIQKPEQQEELILAYHELNKAKSS